MNPKDFFVYITTNPGRTTLYTGVTNDLVSRLAEHYQNAGVSCSFAGRYHCHRLIYFETFIDIRQAITREKVIKGWVRKKKIALIESFNPDWRFLNEDIQVLYSRNGFRLTDQ